MTDEDEIEILRLALQKNAEQESRGLVPPESGICDIIVRTKTIGTYPTVAGAFFACETGRMTGDEVEGGAATYEWNDDLVYVYNIGGTKPPSGTGPIGAYRVPYRWVMSYN